MIGLALEIARQTGAAIAELTGGGNDDAVTAEHVDDRLADRNFVFDAAFREPDAERLILDDLPSRRCREIFAVRAARRPFLRRFGRGRHQARRTAIIEMGSGSRITERRRDIETLCGIAAVVMEADPSFCGEGRQIVMKRRPCGRTRAVMEPKIDAAPLELVDHRDDRRDADPAGDQKMSLSCCIKREVVARQ